MKRLHEWLFLLLEVCSLVAMGVAVVSLLIIDWGRLT